MSIIRLTFEGMLVLFLKDGRPYCDVGFIKNAPGHTAHVHITKIPWGGQPETIVHLHDADLASQLWLDVKNKPTEIELFRDPQSPDPFQRALTPGNDSDFRWAVDFNGEDLYKGLTISVNPAGLEPKLQINDGKFYAQLRSRNKLLTREGNSTTPKIIGPVAVRLGAEIILAGNQLARFSNGAQSQPVDLTNQPRLDYGIYVAKIRSHHDQDSASPEEVSPPKDAENYYSALCGNIAPTRKLHFDRDQIVTRVTPDAACFPAWCSTTDYP